MALNLVSPGVKVREVDLTIGRIDDISDQVGAIAGPFAKGPVNVPILVETEQDLLNTFGKPYSSDDQYEYWYTASSYLSYGGVLRVIRSDGSYLSNANAPVGVALTTLKVTSTEDYFNNHTSDSDWYYAARNPGSWANDLKVCVIDSLADQRLAIGTDGLVVGYAITAGFSTSYAKDDGTVGVQTGFIKGMITKVNAGSVDVKLVSMYDNTTQAWSNLSYEEGSAIAAFQGFDTKFAAGLGTDQGNFENRYRIYNNSGVEQRIERYRFNATVGAGQTVISLTSLDTTYVTFGDQLKSENGTYTANVIGFSTSVVNGVIVDLAAPVAFANTSFIVKTGIGTGLLLTNVNTATDWYNQQTLGLNNTTVYWKNIAPRPATTQYAGERNARHDEFHVVVADDTGRVTGTAGNIIEKWTGLSKARDAKISPSTAIYYKDYIASGSNYIFAGASETGIGIKFTSNSSYTVDSTGVWGGEAQSTTFNAIGTKTYTLGSGYDYGQTAGSFDVQLGDIVSSYSVLDNPAEYSVNFLLQGPSGGASIFESQAKASKLIQIAGSRKDCIACISPHRSGVIGVTNSDAQTSSIIQFFDGLPSSSYAVFDSGYKYIYDRFNNVFRYVPLNGDIAGLMARTSINAYPWFSPAGSQRGSINNAVKLAYNPSQAQRDLLYPKRINPVVFSPGAGIIMFGDKTALKEASAFDRINVRRLFLTIEQTIERAAKAQLFEFNDVLTRTNFLNIVEPYLRDVKSKRGISDFVVICDETNNTPDVIDSNQFRADIFVKPARSINFIGLTFVATRSGISFDEVIGAV
jgi:hypothetical protein